MVCRSNIFVFSSGRRDLNPRPLGPEPSALAGLRYAPNYSTKILQFPIRINEANQEVLTQFE